MTNLKIYIGLVVSAVLCFGVAAFSLRLGRYSAKTELLCNTESEKQRAKDPKTCGVWDGAQCRKGKPEGLFCAAQANYVPLSFVIIGLLFIIALIVFTVYSKFFNKSSSKND